MLKRLWQPLVSGFVFALPLGLTAGVLFWLAVLIHDVLGPTSGFGRVLGAIGLTLVASEAVAYAIGVLLVLVLTYLLGLLVQTGLKVQLAALLDVAMQGIPVVRSIYRASQRLSEALETPGPDRQQGMQPVLCMLGGPGSAAVLALRASARPIEIDGARYVAVLIPTAPVPVGGAILYVPETWVRIADMPLDEMLNVYVSMGATSADSFRSDGPRIWTGTGVQGDGPRPG